MIDVIYRSIQEELAQVEDKLKAAIDITLPPQIEPLYYSLSGSGKRARPVLALLAGKLYDYNAEPILSMAAAIELLHTATLVHDDTIDQSPIRRNKPTVNKLWGQETAILVGDYLFAKAMEYAASTGYSQMVKLLTQTLQVIIRGELNQYFNAFNLRQTRQQYIERIAQKTSSLLSLATQTGAILGHAPERSVEILREYGYNLGIAFQIVDDILDFVGTEEEMGKPTGSDLAQGTLTLPAMLILNYYPKDNPVKKIFENGVDQNSIKQAIEIAKNSTIIQECYQVASEYSSKACRNLESLPDNTSRQSLIEIADYVVNRKR